MRIKFKGKEFLLIGNLKDGGVIATEEQYENFLPSFAYLGGEKTFLVPIGKIYQYGKEIGTVKDIEIIKEQTINDKV